MAPIKSNGRTLQTYGLEDLSQATGRLVVLQNLHKTQACLTGRRWWPTQYIVPYDAEYNWCTILLVDSLWAVQD